MPPPAGQEAGRVADVTATRPRALRRLLRGTVLAYVVLAVVWGLTDLAIPGFRTLQHTFYVLQVASFLGIAAAGQTIVILMAGIDLSVSGLISLAGVVTAQLLATTQLGTAGSVSLALAAVVLLGLLNGLGIAYLRLPPLIMTLAMVSIIEGGLLIFTNGTPLIRRDPFLDALANGRLPGGLPNPVVVWLVVAAFTIWLLGYTRFGRHIYALGTNPRATYLAGVPVNRVQIVAYMLSGLSAGIAGLLLLGYSGASYITMGTTYQLGTISAVVIGGTSILGGRGSYAGTIAGALLLTVIMSLLAALRMAEAGRQVLQGLLILLLLFSYGRGRRGRL